MSKHSEQTTKNFDGGDPTGSKQRGRTEGLAPCWKPGQSGNPAGRPRGSRNRLSEQFLDETFEVWQEHGKSALISMATKQPSRFVRMVALLIPAHFKIEHEHPSTLLTEEQVEARIAELSAALGLGNGARGS